MQTNTVLFIVLAAIVALVLVLFQYYYKSKVKGKTIIVLSFLRFISIFGILLLLINPKFTKKNYEIIKTNLIFLLDNSSSVKNEKTIIKNLVDELTTNEIKDKFTVHKYAFGKDFEALDSLSFAEKNTNIAKALVTTDAIYARANSAIVLLTDGNQTIGQDYEYLNLKKDISIFPICLGDTTRYDDIRIEQVNSNPYSFLKNKFPLEVVVNYDGNLQVNKTVTVTVDGKKEYQENISLSKNNNTKTINVNLNALTVGVKPIKVSVASLNKEKNTFNNHKTTYIEVIDETTKIAIVSSILHPDIGALKKSIEINKQREVVILEPSAALSTLENIDLFILYQPNVSFSSIYNFIQKKQANTFTFTGTNTDWRFLNTIQKSIQIQTNYPVQEVIPKVNKTFSKFDVSEFNTLDYPPLETNAGPIRFTDSMEPLLNMTIKGVEVNNPMLFFIENNTSKNGYWFGQNIWKWRIQEYRNTKSFLNFDDFIGKLMFYLTSSKTKNRLNVDYKSIYEGNTNAKITATYFDESFTFDPNANIIIALQNKKGDKKVEIPLLLKQDFFEVDLSNLPPDDYDFKIIVAEKGVSKSGSFLIKDFNVEQQFLSSNAQKLQSLANKSGANLLFPNQIQELKKSLLNTKQFLPVQKKIENIVPLVDFKILLALIISSLTIEWFIRKYKGLM